MKTIRYNFEAIQQCEMCGDDTTKHKVLGIRLNQSQGIRPKKKDGIAVSVKKCANCELIYAHPMPVPADIQDHYGIPPETYWKPEYFKWHSNYFASEIKTLKSKLLDFTPGMSALDIGAGLGKCMISLEQAGFEAYGFEPSVPFYERAISEMKINPERIKLAKIEDVVYEPNSFDFITFGAVFEQLYHPAASLEKALHWLKPNGIIHIEVPSSNYLISKLLNAYYRLVGTNYVTNISPMHVPFHLYEFSLRSFVQLGQKLNYEVALHDYYVCDIFFFPKLLHKPLSAVMKATNTGMQLAVWLRKAK